jgi:hypothetical protein
MSKYMHTIDGKPAMFDGWQIVYATFYGKPNILRNSLKEIKADQAASNKNRLAAGFSGNSKLSYLRYE